MKIKIILIVTIVTLLSCDRDSCGNAKSISGKYLNSDNPSYINYILIKPNNLYFQVYKNGNIKRVSKGKWISSDYGDCKLIFYDWENIIDSSKSRKKITNEAYFRNDKLYFEDIDNEDYEKEN